MRSISRLYFIFSNVIIKIFILGEFFLLLRLVLKYLSASPMAPVVNFIYKHSDTLVSPFKDIFPSVYWPKGFLIEVDTIAAMVGYAIAAFVIFQLIWVFIRD